MEEITSTQNKVTPIEYLDQYKGLNLFFRAETLIQENPSIRNKVLEYCLSKEANSGLYK